MATIQARRRPIRDGAERSNELNFRISQSPSAPAETIVPRREAQNKRMVPPERRVEGAAKIATRLSSQPQMAVVLLPRPVQQRSKSSLRKLRAWCSMCRSEPLRRCKPERPLKPPGVIGPNLGVDDARRPLAVERIENLLG